MNLKIVRYFHLLPALFGLPSGELKNLPISACALEMALALNKVNLRLQFLDYWLLLNCSALS